VSVRTRRTAVAASFFVQGLLFISLTLRLPQVKEVFGLSDLGLAGLMLLLVLLAGAGSVGAEVVAHHRDSAVAVRCALGLVAAGILLLGLALTLGNLAVLVGAMAVYGLGLGGNDAASNMQAVAVEHRLGRPVMPSFHAAWTAGGLLATLGAIALPQLAFGVASLVLALAPLATLRAPFLRRDHGATAADRRALGVPWRTIVLVGLGLVLFYTVDTAVTAWGPVYLSSDDVFTDPPTSPSMYALATLPYLLATLLARWAGDATTARHGAPTVVRVGALTAFVGLATVVLAPPALWQVGVVGFFVVGLGVAVVAPLAFSAAARVAGRDGPEDAATHRARVDAVVARFNQFNYAGALLGSVLTGVVGTSTLRVGFAVPMVLVLGLLPLARHFASPGADG
jgi:MFS family permease